MRTYLEALGDILGTKGLHAILKVGGLGEWIENPPPDNLAKEVDFADFSKLCAILDDFYGIRGGHGVARRASWASYAPLRQALADIPDVSVWDQVELSMEKKIKGTLVGTARIISGATDQYTTVEEDEQSFFFTVHKCPVCWDRTSDIPICHMTLGALEEAMRWSFGGRWFVIEEIQCIAMGDEVCQYRTDKFPFEDS